MNEFIHKAGEKNSKMSDFIKENEGTTFFVRFERLDNVRSLSKNKAYWAGIVSEYRDFFHDLGHSLTLREVHSWLKSSFNGVDTELGVVGQSTRKMSDDEFKHYMGLCESWLINKKEELSNGH